MKKVKVKIAGNWVETVGLNNKYNDAPVGTGQHLVTFYDFNGKVLKRQRVATGGNATAPTTPTHEFLTFAEWNNPFTNVQSDIDTGAIYNTTDGKTYLFITLTAVTGLAPTLYFSKSSTSLLTINWGDGTTSTSTTSGNQNIQHTYASAGDYIITVDNSAGGTFSIGNSSTTTSCFYGYVNILRRAYLAHNITANGFNSHLLNEGISISPASTKGASGAFGSSKIKHLNYNSLFVLQPYEFYGTATIQKLTYNLVTIIGDQTFFGLVGLRKLIFPATLTAIANTGNFQGCTAITVYIFLSTTPPTLANINAFTGINPICKIYVPDASVAAYKAATNWVTYSAYIYPLSEKPQSDE